MSNLRKHLPVPLGAAFLLAMVTATSWGAAAPPDVSELHRRFVTANEHYQNQEFKEALAQYRRLIDAGVRDPVLFYNAGNAYVQLDQKGRAVAMYERALRLAPRDSRARKNLNYVRPQGGESLRPFVLWRPFLFLRDLFSLNEWLLIFAALVVWVAVGWSLVLLVRRSLARAIAGRFLLVGIVLAAMAVGFLPWRWYEQSGRRVGVVVEKGVVSRHGPSLELDEHLSLAEGTRVQVVGEERGDWLCIRPLDLPRESRVRSYVEKSAVEEI